MGHTFSQSKGVRRLMLRKRKTLWWLLVVGVTLGAEGEGAAEEWRLWRNSGSSISQKYLLPSKRRDLSDLKTKVTFGLGSIQQNFYALDKSKTA